MEKILIPQNGAFSIGFQIDEPIGDNVLVAVIKPFGSKHIENIKWQGSTADDSIEKLSEQTFAVNVTDGLNATGEYEAEFMLKNNGNIIARQTIPITFTHNTIGKL